MLVLKQRFAQSVCVVTLVMALPSTAESDEESRWLEAKDAAGSASLSMSDLVLDVDSWTSDGAIADEIRGLLIEASSVLAKIEATGDSRTGADDYRHFVRLITQVRELVVRSQTGVPTPWTPLADDTAESDLLRARLDRLDEYYLRHREAGDGVVPSAR